MLSGNVCSCFPASNLLAQVSLRHFVCLVILRVFFMCCADVLSMVAKSDWKQLKELLIEICMNCMLKFFVCFSVLSM